MCKNTLTDHHCIKELLAETSCNLKRIEWIRSRATFMKDQHWTTCMKDQHYKCSATTKNIFKKLPGKC